MCIKLCAQWYISLEAKPVLAHLMNSLNIRSHYIAASSVILVVTPQPND